MSLPRLSVPLLPLLLALATASASALPLAQAAWAGGQPEPSAEAPPASLAPPAPTAPLAAAPLPAALLQRIRQLLGLNPPIAVGGSRGSAVRKICLITPHLNLSPDGQAQAQVPIDTPTILVAEPLAEIRLETPQGFLLWRRQASSREAISGPIPWPVPPLLPNMRLLLRSRPLGASGGDSAVVVLQAAPAEVLERHRADMEALQGNPNGWLSYILAAIEADDLPLASAFIFHPSAPLSPGLLSLRRALTTDPCR